MTIELEKFEAGLIRFVFVGYRFTTIYSEFPKHDKTDPHSTAVKSLFREFTIEQLHNLLKIRADMLKIPEFKKLDDVISPIIKPIIDCTKPIKLIRSNYISHVQDGDRKFNLGLQEIYEKHTFPTAFGFYQFLCGLAMVYTNLVEINFWKESNRSNKKYDTLMGMSLPVYSPHTLKNYREKIHEIRRPVIDEMTKLGLPTRRTDLQIAELKNLKNKKNL